MLTLSKDSKNTPYSLKTIKTEKTITKEEFYLRSIFIREIRYGNEQVNIK